MTSRDWMPIPAHWTRNAYATLVSARCITITQDALRQLSTLKQHRTKEENHESHS